MATSDGWTSRKVRETFLSFFEEKGHARVASSSLVPAEDPTLLFTNAGMNQFKDLFLGREKRAYARATSSQKCVRAGGKHNDLDNVGYTARHHTFFEMLGNFSFGDYFKVEAIDYAWELVTGRYGLDPSRLWATVYADDDEAAALWERYLPKARIARFGEKDNFWSMGDTGPCGPCSEIHYDQGEGVPGDATPNGAGDRVMEIWNLVFMQFDRGVSGKMTPLPKPSVDTGAGLERITAILEGKNNNYDTDLFAGIIGKIEEVSGKKYAGGMAVEDAPFRVIADHARAATMLVADGVIPSNEGRGYVLRRIIRRALRYGRRLETKSGFFYQVAQKVPYSLEPYFPTDERKGQVGRLLQQVLLTEETQFAKTMSVGVDRVGEAIEKIRRDAGEKTVLEGATIVFPLYDTYGVPLEVIEEIAQDEGVLVDRAGFEKALQRARERSKSASKFENAELNVSGALLGANWSTEFLGYPEQSGFSLDGATAKAIFDNDSALMDLGARAGEQAWVITDKTVFYPEGGGQVADIGHMSWKTGEARVLDVRWVLGHQFIAHRIRVEQGRLEFGETINLRVDEWTRRKTQANHTGTHLLHAALRQVLGESVRQMGSLVAPDRLRFDYASSRPTTDEEIVEIERLVNEKILQDKSVSKSIKTMDEAKRRGAVAFFGEKYGERVRVVEVGTFSRELCGGCHVKRTGEIGSFKVISDRGLAAGVRRMEAVTSLNTIERLRRDENIVQPLAELLNVPPEEILVRVRGLLDDLRKKNKENAALKVEVALTGVEARGAVGTVTVSGAQPGASASGHSPSKKGLSSDASGRDNDGIEEIAGVKVLARRVPSLPANELRNLADTFRSKLKSGVVLLGTELEGKVTLLAAVTPDLVARVSAHELAQVMAPAVGGKGGGKPDLAQAGGKDAAQIEPALALGVAKVRERLST
jgi:alanyl-tRNA synthetase